MSHPHLTTFKTPFGCYQFTRLPFGITVLGDAFQRRLDAIYSNLHHTICIADDMIVWGEKPDFQDHDKALDKFMQVTRQNNLCLSIEKIQYCKDQVEFFGTTYTTKGHKPTNDKIKAITEMHQPTNVRELQCFLGMCNVLSKCSPRMAELSEDLCQLTCKGVQFNWGPKHSEAFQALKRELTSAPVLAYYDPSKPVVLQTDASTWGLGAVLIQQNKPIYFASKAFQESQKKM